MRLALTIAAAALALSARAADPPATSERFAYSTFRERTDRVSVFVDGYPASLHAADAYLPVPVAVALLAGGRSIPLSPESFTLVDGAGNAVAAAGYRELTERYGKVTFDRALIRLRPLILGTYASSLFRVSGAFYPPSEAGTRVRRVEVPPYAYFRDVLYFPMPPAGLRGVLMLRTAVPDGSSVDVRFVASAADLAKLPRSPSAGPTTSP